MFYGCRLYEGLDILYVLFAELCYLISTVVNLLSIEERERESASVRSCTRACVPLCPRAPSPLCVWWGACVRA